MLGLRLCPGFGSGFLLCQVESGRVPAEMTAQEGIAARYKSRNGWGYCKAIFGNDEQAPRQRGYYFNASQPSSCGPLFRKEATKLNRIAINASPVLVLAIIVEENGGEDLNDWGRGVALLGLSHYLFERGVSGMRGNEYSEF